MNARQRKFAHEYVKNGFVGVLAVYAAGYQQGYGSARVTASRLLTKANVRKAVEEHIKRAKLSADEVLEELSDIAKTKTEIDGNQRLKALELLGKGHKLFVDRLEQTTTDSSSESAILKSIDLASKRDQIEPNQAAIQLFQALRDDPQFSDLSSWPAEYRSVIQAHLTQPQEVTESSLEQ